MISITTHKKNKHKIKQYIQIKRDTAPVHDIIIIEMIKIFDD